jgi:hypothetical protein
MPDILDIHTHPPICLVRATHIYREFERERVREREREHNTHTCIQSHISMHTATSGAGTCPTTVQIAELGLERAQLRKVQVVSLLFGLAVDTHHLSD